MISPLWGGWEAAEMEAADAGTRSLVASSLGPLSPYGKMESFQRLRDVTAVLQESFFFVMWRNKISTLRVHKLINGARGRKT